MSYQNTPAGQMEKASYSRGDYANMAAQPECTPVSVVTQQTGMLLDRLEVLRNKILRLEDRVGSVLRNGNPPTPKQEKLRGSTGVLLGDTLMTMIDHAQESINRLDEINERIEL